MTFTPDDYATRATQDVPTCNLCGGARFATVATQDRFAFPATSVMCEACSLIWLTPRMDADGYRWFYESGTYRALVAEHQKVEDHKQALVDSQRNYFAKVSKSLDAVMANRQGQTVLDIGGSTGVIAAGMRDRWGVKPIVVDPSAEEVEQAAALGLTAVQWTLDSLIDIDPAPVVCLFQTVEHLMDVRAGLAKLRSLMRVDGILILDVCEIRWSIMRHSSMARAMKIDHPFALSDFVLRAYLRRAGLHVRNRYEMNQEGLPRKWLYVCGRADAERNALPDADDLAEMRELVRRGMAWDQARLEQHANSPA